MKEWANITLESLIEADKIAKSDRDELDKSVAIVALILGRTEDYVLDLPKDQLLKVLAKYRNLRDLKGDQPVKDFNCSGYSWTPRVDISKFSVGEYIDCSELIKDKDSLIERLPDLLAVICEPYKAHPLFIKTKPKLDFDTKRKLLLKAKAEDVYPIALFFCRLLIHLTADTVASLESDLKKMKEK